MSASMERRVSFFIAPRDDNSNGTTQPTTSESFVTVSSGDNLLPRKGSSVSQTSSQLLKDQEYFEKIHKAFIKLRIYFTMLCVVNLIVIALVGLFFTKLFLEINNKSDDKIVLKIDSKNEKLPEKDALATIPDNLPVIDCAALKQKFKMSIPGKTEQNCTLDDVINYVVKYSKSRRDRGTLYLTNGIPYPVSVSDGKNKREYELRGWKIDPLLRPVTGSELSENQGTIKMQKSGYYFIYSHVLLATSTEQNVSDLQVQHSLKRKESKGDIFEDVQISTVRCSNRSFVHNSHMQRLIYLEAGDEIKIVVTGNKGSDFLSQRNRNKENYFGIFKI